MLSERKGQFYVCTFCGGKLHLQDTSEHMTYPQSSLVTLDEKSV